MRPGYLCNVIPKAFWVGGLVGALGVLCWGAEYTVQVVDPPVTNHLILPEGPLPPVCQESRILQVLACRGEYEPASFVVSAPQPLKGVKIEVGPVTGPGGTWPPEAVDVRVVKEFYRNTLAGGRAAMPTLLVHDESFLAIEPAPTEENPQAFKNVVRGELVDTLELQPVTVQEHKQFWITVQVPEEAPTGTYRATVRILPQNGEPSELTLQIEVYPFKLRPPMLEYSIYYPNQLLLPGEKPHGFHQVTAEQFRLEARNMLAHGLSNPNIYWALETREDGSLNYTRLEQVLQLRESEGMRPRILYLVSHPLSFSFREPLSPEGRQRTQRYAREINAWARARGYEEVFYMAVDELWGEELSRERDSMAAVREAGGHVFAAVMYHTFFDRVGDELDRPVLLGGNWQSAVRSAAEKYSPEESLRHSAEIARAASFESMIRNEGFRKAIDGVHRLGYQIFTYINPPGGFPFPDLQRRHQGLGLWRVGFDGTMNWAYVHYITQRIDPVEQNLSWAPVFRTDRGVLDTLHWEGFREGVDDVRYLTTLLTTLNQVMGRFPDDPLVAETQVWVQQMDVAHGDLDALRREMAQRIMALLALGYQELPPEQALADVDLRQLQVIPLPEPWRFQIDPDDQGVAGQWFGPAFDDRRWTSIRTDQEAGWEKQGFEGPQAVGFGWYRATLPIGAQDLAQPFRYLHFGAVDEEAWVYLNGKQVFENTVESTGLPPYDLWLMPFAVSLDGVELRGQDLLAVRVHNSDGMGGIWKPVHLILSPQALTRPQLQAVLKLRRTKSQGGQ